MLSGMDSFAYLAQNPELARIFDNAMTSFSNLIGTTVAAAYDFCAWESLTDIGGGNGILLSHILKTHKTLHGVLADVPHVLDRARERGFLSGEIAPRVPRTTRRRIWHQDQPFCERSSTPAGPPPLEIRNDFFFGDTLCLIFRRRDAASFNAVRSASLRLRRAGM